MPNSDEQQVMPSASVAEEEIQLAPGKGSDGEEAPREIVRSIYDGDLDYRQKAHAAAENYVAPFSPDSMLRWRPVRVELASFLTGSYLEEGSMPESFQITPFPDTTLTVTKTKYTIMSFIDSASWEGTIIGSDNGRIEVSIVGGVDSPAFVIKIINAPQIISISPTESPNVYVAVEGNPFQPEATL